MEKWGRKASRERGFSGQFAKRTSPDPRHCFA
jgi:hypothetical protein